MLFEEIKKIAPPLSAFLEGSPQTSGKKRSLSENQKGYHAQLDLLENAICSSTEIPEGKGTRSAILSPFSNGDQFGAKVKHNARSQSILSST